MEDEKVIEETSEDTEVVISEPVIEEKIKKPKKSAVEKQGEEILKKMDKKDSGGRRVKRSIEMVKEEKGKRYFEIKEYRGNKKPAIKRRVYKIT